MVSVERAVQYIEDVPREVSPRGTVSLHFQRVLRDAGRGLRLRRVAEYEEF